MEANIDSVTQSLVAEKLIEETVLLSSTTEAVSDYKKARQLVCELYSQSNYRSDPEQYLAKVCDVLSGHDRRLTQVAHQIKSKS